MGMTHGRHPPEPMVLLPNNKRLQPDSQRRKKNDECRPAERHHQVKNHLLTCRVGWSGFSDGAGKRVSSNRKNQTRKCSFSVFTRLPEGPFEKIQPKSLNLRVSFPRDSFASRRQSSSRRTEAAGACKSLKLSVSLRCFTWNCQLSAKVVGLVWEQVVKRSSQGIHFLYRKFSEISMDSEGRIGPMQLLRVVKGD